MEDNRFGTTDENGTWVGMVGDVVSGVRFKYCNFYKVIFQKVRLMSSKDGFQPTLQIWKMS